MAKNNFSICPLLAYVLLIFLLGCIMYIFQLHDLIKNVDIFLKVYGAYFVIYALLAIFLSKSRNINIYPFVISSILIAILLLLMPTNLSKDVYRYIWDGQLLSHGFNPYLYLPTDPALAQFQHSWLYSKLDWKDQYTVYPPAAQIIYSMAYLAYLLAGLTGAKFVLALPSIILAIFLYKKIHKNLWILFILNPLLLFETFYGAHIDMWAVLFCILFYFYYEEKKYTRSAVFLALGTLAKIFPGLFLALIIADLFKQRSFWIAVRYLIIFSVVVVALYTPFLIQSFFPLYRYQSFALFMEFNNPVFRQIYEHMGNNISVAKAVALKVCGMSIIITLLYALTRKLSITSLLLVYLAYLVFSPVAYPWYTLFFIPFIFLCMDKNRNYLAFIPFVIMQLLISLTYFTESTSLPSFEYRQLMFHRLEYVEISIVCLIVIFSPIFFKSFVSYKQSV